MSNLGIGFANLANKLYTALNDWHAYLRYIQSIPTNHPDYFRKCDFKYLHSLLKHYNYAFRSVESWLKSHPLPENIEVPPPVDFSLYHLRLQPQTTEYCNNVVCHKAGKFFRSYKRLESGTPLPHDIRQEEIQQLNDKKVTLDQWVSCFRNTDEVWPSNPSANRHYDVTSWKDSRAGLLSPVPYPGTEYQAITPGAKLTPPMSSLNRTQSLVQVPRVVFSQAECNKSSVPCAQVIYPVDHASDSRAAAGGGSTASVHMKDGSPLRSLLESRGITLTHKRGLGWGTHAERHVRPVKTNRAAGSSIVAPITERIGAQFVPDETPPTQWFAGYQQEGVGYTKQQEELIERRKANEIDLKFQQHASKGNGNDSYRPRDVGPGGSCNTSELQNMTQQFQNMCLPRGQQPCR